MFVAAIIYVSCAGTAGTIHACMVFSPGNCSAIMAQLNSALYWRNLSSNTLFFAVPFSLIGILALVADHMARRPRSVATT